MLARENFPAWKLTIDGTRPFRSADETFSKVSITPSKTIAGTAHLAAQWLKCLTVKVETEPTAAFGEGAEVLLRSN